MKIIVSYRSIVREEIEVDDRFTEALTAFDNGNYQRYDELTDELHQEIAGKFGDIIAVYDGATEEVIYEC
jgi:hypothetical protein